ncbi:MAG TPA: proline dehydrogenase family protein [Chitinophagaceae bacterium]|nr:proline dehydrogenase family protein [Chitinophagaceae bacterium]
MSLNFDNTEIAFSLKNNFELKRANFLFSFMAKPLLTKIGISFTQLAFKLYFPIKGLIKNTIFKQFCGGETLIEANETALKLSQYNVSVIMDYGVEGKSDETEFEKTTNIFLQTIKFASDKPYIPFVSLKVTGFCRIELLEKINAEILLTKEEEQEFERFQQRVDSICYCATQYQKKILIDAEESWIQQPVDDITNKMMAKYNKEQVVVYNTFQLYRHDRYAYLKESHQMAIKNGYLLGAKLVRGAYMEKERKRAVEQNYTSPIQATKEDTDKDYNLSLQYCVDHLDQISLFIGTHNEQSCMLATTLIAQRGFQPNHPHICFSQLYGMSDNISFNLAKEGFQVSKYLPYGPVEEVIPYLMRRAQENTSVAGQTGRELGLIQKEMKRRKLHKSTQTG